MNRCYVFENGQLLSKDLPPEALALVKADEEFQFWVDLQDPSPDEINSILGDAFHLPQLLIDDCLRGHSLPKALHYEGVFLVVLHRMEIDENERLQVRALHMVLGKNFLITLHTGNAEVIDTVTSRISATPGARRPKSPDKILLLLLEILADEYQPSLASMQKRLEDEEGELLEKGGEPDFCVLLDTRRDMQHFRELLHHQHEVVLQLAKAEYPEIRPALRPYFRSVSERILRIEFLVSGLIENALRALDMAMNRAQMDTNKTIKILTIFTFLTTPAMMIGTWYGMNFQKIPELSFPGAYPIAAAATLSITLLIWWLCRRAKWL